MSLFICQNPDCQCVENTNLVSKNKNIDERFPNMGLMDMKGYGDLIYVGHVLNQHYKEMDEVLMLCSECNTGTWHNEFPKEKASDNNLEVAALSKYSAVTPMDHPRGSIVKNPNSEWGCKDEYMKSHWNPSEVEIEHGPLTKEQDAILKSNMEIQNILDGNFVNKPADTQSSLRRHAMKLRLAELKRERKLAKKSRNLTEAKRLLNEIRRIKNT